jgi:hypothetical protein
VANEIHKIALLQNIGKIHTAPMGVERIKKNLEISVLDVVDWLKDKIKKPIASVTRKGKNWYVQIDDCEITINAYSYTIITAHKKIKEKRVAFSRMDK